jgi:hypothetical protein
MDSIDYNKAEKLAGNIRATHESIDDALANVATLTSSVLEVCRASEIHPAKSQAIIAELAGGLTKLADARGGFLGAHRQIVKVQRDSDLQTVDFGCLGPIPSFGRADLKVVG